MSLPEAYIQWLEEGAFDSGKKYRKAEKPDHEGRKAAKSGAICPYKKGTKEYKQWHIARKNEMRSWH